MIGIVSAESIELIYPENVNIGEVFNIKLILNDFSEEVYDIKIDFKNSDVENFLDDEWEVADWIEEAMNISEMSSQSFEFNITGDYVGVDDFIVEVRNNESDWLFDDYHVNISMIEIVGNESDTESNDIYLEMSWNEKDIVNGDEFEIEVKVFNLEDKKYDIKIWIEFEDNDTIISNRYDEENDEWKSGVYYVNEFFSGAGDKSGDIKLQMRDDYEDYYGDAKIFFRLRDGFEIEEDIEILEREEKVEDEPEPEIPEPEEEVISAPITGNVISLGSSKTSEIETEDIKRENNIVYESSVEKIKKYSILGFAFLCLFFSLLMVKEKL